MRFGLRYRLILSLSGLIAILVLVLQFAISWQVSRRIRSDIKKNFNEKAEFFTRIQDIRFRQLRQTAILLADIPALRAAVSTGDAPTVQQKLRDELRPLLDFDPVIPDSLIPETFLSDADSAGLLVVCDPEGKVLGQLATTGQTKFSIAGKPGIEQALSGEYAPSPSIWKAGGRYFTALSVPVWSASDVLGSMTYGFPFRKAEAVQLARDIDSEVSFLIGEELVATSFTGLSSEENDLFVKSVLPAAYDAGKTGNPAEFSITLRKEEWIVFVAAIEQAGAENRIPGYYAIASSLTARMTELRQLQWYIALLGLTAILVAVLLSTLLGARISKPIDALVQGIRRMQTGDYSKEIPVLSTDETGVLTDAFNQMLRTLRERLEMLKFVSNATLEAISKNLTDRELGGLRKEVTVFFSDIRGFTRWSEKRRPEEVIAMLNQTLSLQAEIVKKHGGDIDKFVGDELVAVFEGEFKDRNAVQAASEIQAAAEKTFKSKNLEIAIGIGINTGTVVMGAMGSESRMDYTVIGNHVNLGARLCSAAGHAEILISETTARNLDRKTVLREVEPISVKGIEKPVSVYVVEWNHPSTS